MFLRCPGVLIAEELVEMWSLYVTGECPEFRGVLNSEVFSIQKRPYLCLGIELRVVFEVS